MKNLILLFFTVLFLTVSASSQSWPKYFNYSLSQDEKAISDKVNDVLKRVELIKLKSILNKKNSNILIAKPPVGFQSNMPVFNSDPNIQCHIKVMKPNS